MGPILPERLSALVEPLGSHWTASEFGTAFPYSTAPSRSPFGSGLIPRTSRTSQPSPWRIFSASGPANRWTPLSSRPCLPCGRRRYKQQGSFAPRALPRFDATSNPSVTLSPSIDFPVEPVIRSTLLRWFLLGTRRASPVARHVLVTVLSLPPRRGDQPYRSIFG